MSGNRSALRRAIVPVVVIFALCLVPGSALGAKGGTGVGIRIAQIGGGSYEYKVKVKSDKRRCKKHRKVTVWHDENRNGLFDKGEFVIGQGSTDRRGKLVFTSSALPPVGDFIGVFVKENGRCEGFEGSTKFTGFPR